MGQTNPITLVAPLLLLTIVAIGYVYFIERQRVQTPLLFGDKNTPIASAHGFSTAGSQTLRVGTLSHHSASAILLDDGSILVAWFAGSREGASDVAIYTSRIYSPQHMTKPLVAVNRHGLGQALHRYYKKLGNPVISRLADGRLALYVTVVSIGGWSVSSIAVLTSADEGTSWQAERELHASPFLNISTLVKYAPISATTQDGQTMNLLPAYHEFSAKFGQYLLLDEQWRVRETVRLGGQTIQPSNITNNNTLFVAMRDANKKSTERHIQQWQVSDRLWAQAQPSTTRLPNPDAAVDVAAIGDGKWLLAYNNSHTERSNLTLAYSADQGANWHTLTTLENSTGGEFSYPYFVISRDTVHLFYTDNRQAIHHSWWPKTQLHFNP